MSVSEGQLLAGRYRLLAPLGRGGMGVVWRAHDEVLGRDVAVKEVFLPPQLSEEDQQLLFRRTMREARTAARLNHPNVVTVFDVVEEDGRPWIVMEFVPSRSLAEILRENGPMAPSKAAEVGLQVLAALTAAHAAGVLHRDVKPGNVLQGEDGRIVLTDFGIATLEGDSSLTTSGLLIGSPAYIAPERARGRPAGPESDLWSLGVTLYAAVEGRTPFERTGPVSTLAAVATEDPDPVKHAGPLQPVLAGLLQRDPGQRLKAAEAQRMLRRVAATGKEPKPAPPDVKQSAVKQPAVKQPAAEQPAAKPGASIAPAAGAAAASALDPPKTPARSAAAKPRTAPAKPRTAPATATPAADLDTPPSRRRPALLALVAIPVVLVLVGAGVLLRDDDRESPTRSNATTPTPSQSASVTPSASSSPPASASPTPTAPAQSAPSAANPGGGTTIPAGFRSYRDQTGFTVAIPVGWRISREGPRVRIQEPNGARFLLVDQTNQPKFDAVADWTEQEAARRDEIRDYRRIRIVSVNYWREAADWEFTHTSRTGTPLHVISRGFVTSQTQAYGLYWSTPQAQWQDSFGYFQVFTRTFRPRP